MLLSLCLLLKAREADARDLPPTIGRAAHAAFLGLVRRRDSGIAERLHSDLGKPFTVSFSQECLARTGNRLFQSNQGYCLRITSLDEQLSQLLLGMALRLDGLGPLKLLNAEFEVAKVHRSPVEHPWAGQSSFEELYNNWVARGKEGRLPDKVGLKFYSPTAFSLSESKLDLPLPCPRLVFQSVLGKWNHFSSIPLELDLEEVERHVGIKRHRLRRRCATSGSISRSASSESAGSSSIGRLGPKASSCGSPTCSPTSLRTPGWGGRRRWAWGKCDELGS